MGAICKNCDESFVVPVNVRNKIFCSFKCQQDNYRTIHRESLKSKKQAYYQANKEILRERKYNYNKRKEKEDCNFRLARILRKRLAEATKNGAKTGSAVKLLGCSIEYFRDYIGNKFHSGMDWDNYGLFGWHLDHIVALHKFDLSKPQELAKACHFTNYQPIWAKDHYIKSAKERTRE